MKTFLKKKKKKAYISCKGIRKADYEKALLIRYNIIFTSDPADADFFIAPFDKDGLTEKQNRELEEARKLGLDCRLVNSELLLSNKIEDPLNLDQQERLEKQVRYFNEKGREQSTKDKDRELELG